MRKKAFVGLVIGAAAALVASRADATLHLYEPFNYTAGQGLAGVDGQVGSGGNSGNTAASVVPSPLGGTGSPFGQLAPNGNYWMTAGYNNNNAYSQTLDAVTVATDLSYPGLADPTTGGGIQLGGTGSTPRLAFTPVTNAIDGSAVDTYYSLLVQINDISTMQAIGGVIGGFNNTRGSQGNNPSTVGASLWVRGSGAGFVFGVAEQSVNATNSPVYESTERNFGETYLIVGKYTLRGTLNVGGTGGSTDDTAQIWINPTSLGGAEPGGAFVATTNNLDIPTNQTDPAGGNPTIQTFVFRQDGTVGANAPTSYVVDDLRVGTTYADVTPPPAPPGVPGDYDNNGFVDAADFVLWRDNNGTAFQLQNEVAGTTPGQVTIEDYDAWRARFGNPPGSGSSVIAGASVPEPAGMVIVIGLMVPLCIARIRRA